MNEIEELSIDVFEFGYEIIGVFFPPVALGKGVYDFVLEQTSKRLSKKLYWFAKNARKGKIDEKEFVKFFENKEDFYGELLDILARLDTEDAVEDFVKIFNEYRKGTIDEELFRYFIYIITHWMLYDRDIMINIWRNKGAPQVAPSMKKTGLLRVDSSEGYEAVEPLKRLITYGLVKENMKVEIDHKHDPRISFSSETNIKYSYIYSKEAMILCTILGEKQ